MVFNNKKIWNVASVNIQAGLSTSSYKDYLTKSWKHIYPNINEKYKNLELITNDLNEYDIIGIQEVDTGSFRTAFQDQSKWLSEKTVFKNYVIQNNRETGFSTTANAIYSKSNIQNVEFWSLPNRKMADSKRGAIKSSIIDEVTNEEIICIVSHFSLGAKDRLYQASFLAERIQDLDNVILMGDFNATNNCSSLKPLSNQFDGATDLPTFPSWNPKKAIDIIWWKNLSILDTKTKKIGLTDHCAIDVKFIKND